MTVTDISTTCVVVISRVKVKITLKMTTTQVVKTSVTVNNNSPIQDYVHPVNQTQPTFEMTPGFKPFTALLQLLMKMADFFYFRSDLSSRCVKTSTARIVGLSSVL